MSFLLTVVVARDASAEPLEFDGGMVAREADLKIIEVFSQDDLLETLRCHRVDIGIVMNCRMTWAEVPRVVQLLKGAAPESCAVLFACPESESVVGSALAMGLDDFVIDDVYANWRLQSIFLNHVRGRRPRIRAKRLEERLEQLSGLLQLGVFSCEGDGRFVEVNDAMKDLLACSSETELFHTNLISLFNDQDRGIDYLDRLLQSGTPQALDFERVSQDATRFFRVTAKMTAGEGSARMIDGFVEDITAQKVFAFESRRASVAMERISSLSPRERQVFERVADGNPNKVIAKTLEISEKTVEKHRASLMRKLKVVSVAELVRLATYAEHGVA